jgi:hypothetical protein
MSRRKQGERPGKTRQPARPVSSKRLLETPATTRAGGEGEGHSAVAATKLGEISPLGSSATSTRCRRNNPHRERNRVTRLGTTLRAAPAPGRNDTAGSPALQAHDRQRQRTLPSARRVGLDQAPPVACRQRGTPPPARHSSRNLPGLSNSKFHSEHAAFPPRRLRLQSVLPRRDSWRPFRALDVGGSRKMA